MVEQDLGFRAMGCEIRVLAGPAAASHSTSEDSSDSAEKVRELIETFDRELSRFKPCSQLCLLNASEATEIAVSPLLLNLIDAALWAAQSSGGLIDPTVIDQLERVGYSQSLSGATPASLSDALHHAPLRRSARAASRPNWQSITTSRETLTVSRPVGVRIDSGGVGKGLAADTAAVLLSDRSRFCVSAGGDLRIGGPDAFTNPYPVEIADPFGGEPLTTIMVGSGGLATSGLGSRIWQRSDGSYAHHLIDPSTGDSAWTGLVQVTALAPTALEAETLSKRVLLGGPEAIGLLDRFGGVVVHDDCKVELIGALAHKAPRLGFSLAGAAR
jgi:thiamine biosynthesis lipoprotein